MADVKSDKKNESIIALKNANKHLADLFIDLSKKDSTLSICAGDLERIAAQCGDIHVLVWTGSQSQQSSLAKYLKQIAAKLEEAR